MAWPVGQLIKAVSLQSEEEGLRVKQEETNEALQEAEAGEPIAAGLVVPVQNGEGDSLNLSAGFIQVLDHASARTCPYPVHTLSIPCPYPGHTLQA